MSKMRNNNRAKPEKSMKRYELLYSLNPAKTDRLENFGHSTSSEK